jgi:PAS domain S-box-containing protein
VSDSVYPPGGPPARATLGAAVLDREGRVGSADPAFGVAVGRRPESLVGAPVESLLHADEVEVAAAIRRALASPSPILYVAEPRLARARGASAWGRIQLSTGLRAPGGGAVAVLTVEDVSTRRRAEQRLTLQHAVARLLASQRPPLGEEILQAICDALDWDVGVLWIVEARKARLRFLDAFRAPGIHARAFLEASRAMSPSIGTGLPGLAWQRREPVWIEDVPEAGSFFVRGEIARNDGLHGAFCFPIALGDEVLGVLDFWSREVRTPDADLLQLASTLGKQLGQFIGRRRAEAAARGGQRQLRAILDNTTAVVYLASVDGALLLVNERATRFFGPQAAAIGRRFEDLLPAELARTFRERHARAVEASGLLETEEVLVDGGAPLTYLAHSFLLRDAALQPYGVCTILNDITDRKRAEEDVRALAAELSAAEDAERRRLARDIHDSIGQTLSALKIEVGKLPREPDRHADLASALDGSLAILDRLIAQTRTLTFDLYPAMLDDLGLVPTLQSYADEWSARTRVHIEVTEKGARRALSTSIANYLFRSIKELLNNIWKHASATEVVVAVHFQPAGIRVLVADDGVGFDPAFALSPRGRQGLGLADIRQRVIHLGGQFLIDAAKGQGTQVILELPMDGGMKS